MHERRFLSGRISILIGLLLAFVLGVGLPAQASAATLPSGFAESQIATGLFEPTTITFSPDGRMFIAQQNGVIRVMKNGVLLTKPFLKLSNVSGKGERGIESMTFSPNFGSDSYIYVFYSSTTPVEHNQISRFTVNGDVADPSSEVDIFDIDTPATAYHNGGTIRFGPDGDLYVSTGDDGDHPLSQSMASLFGKILRINPDGSIPSDNPFYSTATGVDRAIWALGLRNPYTWAFQPGTGRMIINDVGASSWEELNLGAAGANYGWPVYEGYSNDPLYTSPVYAYAHGTDPDRGCATVGGAFDTGIATSFPSPYSGKYFFGDLCGGWIDTVDPANGYALAPFALNITRPTSVAFGPDGSLYYASRPDWSLGTASVFKISYTGDDSATIDVAPQPISVAVGTTATFSVTASGAGPFSYQWRRDGTDIPGAQSDTYSLDNAQLSDSGATFTVVVTNTQGSIESQPAALTVLNDQLPVPTITLPKLGTTYHAGERISYAGTATDPEDGTLSGTAFTWQIDFHHEDHVHPFLAAKSGSTQGVFTIPNADFETDPVQWFRVILTVKDSLGATASTYVDVDPKLGTMSFATSPTKLGLSLDGVPINTRYDLFGVVGAMRTVDAVEQTDANGIPWVFDSWSDGGAESHAFRTPSAMKTFTAIYHENRGAVGTGAGLTGTYFANSDFTGSTATREDPTVAFKWKSGNLPITGIGPGTFSVRWTGSIEPQFGERYKLALESQGSVRMWVDGVLVIDGSTQHALRTDSAALKWAAGTMHSIRIDVVASAGAQATLFWSSPSTPRSIVPSSQLYP